MKRPGIVISQLRRGPLVEIGSFSIWMRMFSFFLITWSTFPVLMISGSNSKVSSRAVCCLPAMLSSVYFMMVRSFGPMSV